MAIPHFQQFVDEHGAMVLRVCRAVAGPDGADDAWSETFLAALRAWPDIPDEGRIGGWLVTIAHRKAIDVHRERAQRGIPVADPLELDGALNRLTHDAGAVETPLDERDTELWAAMRELSVRQREVIAYHHLAGLPYAEVADLLGTTEGAARRAAADGMAKLRLTYAPGATR